MFKIINNHKNNYNLKRKVDFLKKYQAGNVFNTIPIRFYHNYILSPIFYANASPHIGHMYTALLCDASARYHS